MASHKKGITRKKTRRGRKKVKCNKNRKNTKQTKSPPTSVEDPRKYPQQHNENLILYYLGKLKNLFSRSPPRPQDSDHPTPGSRESCASKMKRVQKEKTKQFLPKPESTFPTITPDKYTSTPIPRPKEEVLMEKIKDKVFNVVSAAIEYGYANNVIEKRGDCFILKRRKNKKVNREQTPGPQGHLNPKCSCTYCKNLRKHADASNPVELFGKKTVHPTKVKSKLSEVDDDVPEKKIRLRSKKE